MEISVLQYILLFLYGGLAGMESVVDEFQFHRPLIACTITGLILGDMKTGIILGSALEMMALGWMNIGAATAPDTALMSTVATILVVAGNMDKGAATGLAITIAIAGQLLTIFVRTATVFFQHAADKAGREGNSKMIDILHVSALSFQFLRIGIPTVAVAATIGNSQLVVNALQSIPEWLTTGLNVGGGMIVVVGYAMVINMIKTPKVMPFLFLGFIFAAFTEFNLIGLGVLGLIIAIVYIQLSPDFNKQEVAVASNSSGGNYDDDLDDELD